MKAVTIAEFVPEQKQLQRGEEKRGEKRRGEELSTKQKKVVVMQDGILINQTTVGHMFSSHLQISFS